VLLNAFILLITAVVVNFAFPGAAIRPADDTVRRIKIGKGDRSRQVAS